MTIESLMAEVERLRSLLRRCMPGPDPVDLGNEEIICLHLVSGQSFGDIKRGLLIGKTGHHVVGTNVGDGVALTTIAHPGDPFKGQEDDNG